MNKMLKLVKYSFIFLLTLSYSFIYVNACENGDVLVSTITNPDGSVQEVCSSTKACKNLYDSNGEVNITAVSDKYQPKLTNNGNGTWRVSLHPGDANDSSVLNALKSVRFKLVSFNGAPRDGSQYVSVEHPLDVTKVVDSEGYMTLIFRVDKEHPDPDCNSEFLEFVVELYDGGEPQSYDEVVHDIPPVAITPGTLVNCALSYSAGSFEQQFCLAKANATVNYADRFSSFNSSSPKKYKDVFGSSSSESFTCNNTIIKSPDEIKAQGEDGYYLSHNTKYMFGSGEYSIDKGYYVYNFSPCNPKTDYDRPITCKVKCEEAVTVQYGAPVASKAGLCIEYKVKVTSRVTCKMTQAPPEPLKITKVCTPTPTCTGIGRSGNRYYLTEGGPNEDFHACVAACDGGKYTSKCSKKCYKDVYQNSLITYKNAKTSSSKYYCQSGGHVSWHGGGPGRYYGSGCKNEYEPDGNGICRHHYSNGTVCQDDCWWNSCPDNVYLNPGYSNDDYVRNYGLYEAAIRECNAAASCSTSQAEFTIAVDYKDDTNTVRTINFPYNQNLPEISPNESQFKKDRLCSRGVTGSCDATATANDTTITGFDGCYNSSSTAETLYLAEWSFPSSWINKKTGELSYLDKQGNSGWQEVKDKFCIPFNAQRVNEQWWRYYYKSLGKDIECPYSSNVETYNIRAKARDFGYYGWNIDVKCFYGIGADDCNSDDPDIKYVIRSIDLDDVFPNVDGTELTDKDNEVGRVPGFNWSDLAVNNKNANYTSSPLDYAKRIQEKGYTIYSDDQQLDYKFRLTPSVLKQLKTARSENYTSFEGTNYTDEKGIIRYKSNLPLLSDNSITLEKPNNAALLCNNMIGRSNCESHTS